MPTFEYYERESDNKISTGYISSRSKEEAIIALKNRGVKLLRLDEVSGMHAQVVERINNLKDLKSKVDKDDGYQINYGRSIDEDIPKTHINYILFVPILLLIIIILLNYYL